jgi:hypothetical protein
MFNFHHSTGTWHPHWTPAAAFFYFDRLAPGSASVLWLPPCPGDAVCASGWLPAALSLRHCLDFAVSVAAVTVTASAVAVTGGGVGVGGIGLSASASA